MFLIVQVVLALTLQAILNIKTLLTRVILIEYDF